MERTGELPVPGIRLSDSVLFDSEDRMMFLRRFTMRIKVIKKFLDVEIKAFKPDRLVWEVEIAGKK
jgi:hypothetical protein